MKKVQKRWIELKNELLDNKNRCFTFLMVYVFSVLVGVQSGYFLLPVLLLVGMAYQLKGFDLNLNQTKPSNLIHAIGLAGLFVLLAQFSIAKTNHFLIALPSSFGAIECIFYGLVFAICEELFFRGLMLKQLSKKIHPTSALILVSLLFGLYTRSMVGIVVGLGLGLLTQKANSVYPALFTNFLFRVILIYEAFNLGQFAGILHMFDASGFVYDWGNGLILLGLGLWCIGIALKAKEKVTN